MARLVQVGLVNVSLASVPLKQRRQELIHFVETAGKQGSNIVLLPEWATHHRCKESLENYGKLPPAAWAKIVGMRPDDPFLKTMARLAKQFKMVVIPDPLLLGKKEATNTCLVYGPLGRILGSYTKTHLAPGECRTVARGESLRPIATPFGKLGLLICFDINFPELTRTYELQGAELLLWTTMRQGSNEDGLYRCRLPARCMEHNLPLGVATWVEEEQLLSRAPMASILYNQLGQPVAGGALTPGVVQGTVDLDAQPIDQREWGHPELVVAGSYVRRQRRPDLYGPLVKGLSAAEADPAREPVVGKLARFDHV
ncbi:MAG: carbon-nitrogen hydrolase family protein [Planctomycetota bacterium]